MNNEQQKLFYSVLTKLQDLKVLPHVLLVGSWCNIFYKDIIPNQNFQYSIKTKDMDIVVPERSHLKLQVDLPKELETLGFSADYHSQGGLIKLNNTNLDFELLVPELGSGTRDPVHHISKLGMSAQALRYLNMLTSDTIQVSHANLTISIPHPITFAFHKLIISTKRKKKEKQETDLENGRQLIEALYLSGYSEEMRGKYQQLPTGWQKTIGNVLEKAGQREILTFLKSQIDISSHPEL
jgi:hypothetical protein